MNNMWFSEENVFIYITLLIHLVYILTAIGLLEEKPQLLDTIEFWLQVYISVFIIWRFNPYYPLKFTNFDRKIVFAAGTFIFTITIVNTYLEEHIDTIKKWVRELLVKTNVSQPQPGG